MRRLVASLALIASSAAAYGDTWSDLWLTSEQQGQRLLAAGKAADAAPLFTDPRRRAYAELQAGKYAAAARRLSPLTDVDSEYNRGNALAHSGDLKGALAAYDTALARQPANADARHNREIVARALQNSGKRPQSESNEPAPQPGSAKNDRRSGREQSAASQKGSAVKEPLSAGTTPGEPGSGKEQKPVGRVGSTSDGQQQQHLASNEVPRAAKQTDSARANTRPAPSEQSLSLDQWLRRIPDDPAELLRRKFLLEHMLRQSRDPQ